MCVWVSVSTLDGDRCHYWRRGLVAVYLLHAVMNDAVVQNVLNKICSVTDVQNQ